jgi:hypothetical protein
MPPDFTVVFEASAAQDRTVATRSPREAAAPLVDELPDGRHVYGQPLRALERDLAVAVQRRMAWGRLLLR